MVLPAAARRAIVVAALFIAGCAETVGDLSEASIAELHDRLQRGELSSEQLVHWYFDRIKAIDDDGPRLNAIIELNPDALLIARALDEEWRTSGPRGPLHGIPVVLKANIDTADKMHTSAGSQMLAGHIAPDDAFIVSQLRDAGAVILGKANLSEWANFRSSRSASGWSSIGGQTRNAYDPQRNPCGSSSGSAVAVAANLTSVAIGTETDGSIVCPAGVNGIVGIKPTMGLVSRSGIIPIAHSQDIAGPMARNVRDAAILLSVIAGRDPQDAVTGNAPAAPIDYAAKLTADGLRGQRIGVLRSHFGAGSNPAVEALLAAALETFRAQGAEVIDDIEVDMDGVGDAEYQVLLHEFKVDLQIYLEESGAPVKSLAEAIAYNEQHAERVMPHFGQEIFLAAEATTGLDDPGYLEALENSRGVTRASLDAAFTQHKLDTLVAITNSPAWTTDLVNGDHFQLGSARYAAVSGYPSVTVPAGLVAGLPVGLSFIGQPFGEPELIPIAYAFEQASRARRPPGDLTGVTNAPAADD